MVSAVYASNLVICMEEIIEKRFGNFYAHVVSLNAISSGSSVQLCISAAVVNFLHLSRKTLIAVIILMVHAQCTLWV